MGFEVSGTYALIFLGFLVATGAFISSVENGSERLIEANGESFAQEEAQLETNIEIVSARWDGEKAVIEIENTGTRTLSVNNTDIFIDGEYIAAESIDTRTVAGRADSDLWAPDEVLHLEIPSANPGRLRIVTEHGISVFVSPVFSFKDRLVFTQGDGLRTLQRGGSVDASYDVTGVKVIGAIEGDFDGDGLDDIPYITSTNDVNTVDTNGSVTTWQSGNARASQSRVVIGSFGGNPLSIYYVRLNELNIRRVDNGSDDRQVKSLNAYGIAGIADIDNDGANELIYGNNSQMVSYLDDDAQHSTVGTGAMYGMNNGVGLGEPGDFDGDGVPQVPIVDVNGDIALVNSTGINATLTSSGPAAKAPIATLDWDGDDELEIVFVGTDGDLYFVDGVTSGNTVKELEDGAGDPVSADDDAGAA